jgi:Undecaprenyl-phosphate galactose phosphotransferase WbaP
MVTPNLILHGTLDTEQQTGGSWRTTGAVVCCDAFSLSIAAFGSMALWVAINHRLTGEMVAALPALVAVFLLCFAVSGLYPGVAVNPTRELRDVSVLITLIYGVLGTVVFLLHGTASYSRGVFILAWLLTLIMVPLLRTLIRRRLAKTKWWGCATVVLARGGAGERMVHSLQRNPELGLRPVAIFDTDPHQRGDVHGVPVLDGIAQLALLAKEGRVRYGILAMTGFTSAELAAALREYGDILPHLYVVPDIFGVSSLWVQATDVAGLLAFRLQHRLLMPSALLCKRSLDLLLTLLVSIPLTPFLLACALLIKIGSPGPIFFGHRRLGKGGKYFKAWKFRSMVVNGDEVLKAHLDANAAAREEWERNQKLRADPRVTWIGRLLRTTSLDELPQLFNVILDEMSLVGPRPIIQSEIPRYGDAIELYHRVAPGITGLWQVSGRNNTTYAERVAWDEYYVRNWSAWLDLHILIRTVDVVLRREGAM